MDAASSQIETLEDRIRRIPLPNEIPRGLDFSGMPAAALKSSTIDSLISQNEDLMARLSVALRKINDLENAGGQSERDVRQLRTRFDALKEQFLVLREKDRLANARGADLQRQNAVARERGDKLERQFTSVYVQGQAFQKRLQRLERYRARVRRAATGLRARAKRAATLGEELTTARADQARLTAAFEGRLVEAREQVSRLDGKARERDALFRENVRLENELVLERRQNAVGRADQQAALDRLTSEAAELRTENRRLAVVEETQTADLGRLNAFLPELKAEREALREQVETLQSLWAQKQRELDGADEKLRNLQALNQSLSVTINEQRRAIEDQRAVGEQQRYAADEQIKMLRAEIQLLRRRTQTND